MPPLYDVIDCEIETIDYDQCLPLACAHDPRGDDDAAFMREALDGCTVQQLEVIYL